MSLDTVKLIFADHYKLSADDLRADSKISELCDDSLEILELLMSLEEQFKMTFPDDVAESFTTLGDIADYMDKNIPQETIESIYNELR